MRRVLLVYEPPDGGVADNVLYLAQGLREHGWEPEVAGPEGSIVEPGIRDAGVRCHHPGLVRGYAAPRRDAAALRALRAILREGRFDVVHAFSSKAGVVGRLAAAREGVPWAYSPQCFSFVGPVGVPRKAFGFAAETALARVGRGVFVCVAEDERRIARRARLAPPERLRLVYNGCPPCPAGLEPDPDLETFAAGGPLAATLSVLRVQKGIEHFLAAAPRILAALPEARLAVIGDGPEGEDLQARARELGLGDRVRFFPYRGPGPRQLASLDLYVLPSLWEAFPFGILEALACGVPQVVTDVGGSAEAVLDGTTGTVVPPADPGALADAIVSLLGDAGRRAAMAGASRARHAEAFGLGDMVRLTAAVYDELTG